MNGTPVYEDYGYHGLLSTALRVPECQSLIIDHMKDLHHNKLVATLQMTYSNTFSCMNIVFWFKFPLTFVPMGLFDNTFALFETIVWYRTNHYLNRLFTLVTRINVTRPRSVNARFVVKFFLRFRRPLEILSSGNQRWFERTFCHRNFIGSTCKLVANTVCCRVTWHLQARWWLNSGSIYIFDVIKWEHFPRYWRFEWGIHR